MSVLSAFQPQGLTIGFVTSGTISTSQSVQITPQNLGLPASQLNFPPQVWLINRGTVDVFVSFTLATATIAIPTAGTTTVGTPTQAFNLVAGVPVVLTVPIGPTLWMQNISGTASQTYYVTFGEGIG
jgi:hypothetical protein